MEFDLFLIKGKKFDKKTQQKNYIGEKIGEVDLPTMPAMYSDYLAKRGKKKKEKPEKVKEDMKAIKVFMEDNNISLEEYRKMEKAQKERNEMVARCKSGLIIFKKKAYKIESIGILNDENMNRILYVRQGDFNG